MALIEKMKSIVEVLKQYWPELMLISIVALYVYLKFIRRGGGNK